MELQVWPNYLARSFHLPSDGQGGVTGLLSSEVSLQPLVGSLVSASFLLDLACSSLKCSSTPLWRLLLFLLPSLVLLSLSLSIPKGCRRKKRRYSCQGLGPKWHDPSLLIYAHPLSTLRAPRNGNRREHAFFHPMSYRARRSREHLPLCPGVVSNSAAMSRGAALEQKLIKFRSSKRLWLLHGSRRC